MNEIGEAEVDFSHLVQRSMALRAKYAALEQARSGKSWTPEQLMWGFVGDVGDLAKLAQG